MRSLRRPSARTRLSQGHIFTGRTLPIAGWPEVWPAQGRLTHSGRRSTLHTNCTAAGRIHPYGERGEGYPPIVGGSAAMRDFRFYGRLWRYFLNSTGVCCMTPAAQLRIGHRLSVIWRISYYTFCRWNPWKTKTTKVFASFSGTLFYDRIKKCVFT